MSGESDLQKLLKSIDPLLHEGQFVFCTVENLTIVDLSEIVCSFKESEGYTLIISKEVADRLMLPYIFIAAWITLKVHSSLSAVGLTAAFSSALSKESISCNVVAAYYHDHIFVPYDEREKAMKILESLKNA